MNIQTTLWLIFMFWNSLWDIRKKQISLIACFGAMTAGGLLLVLEGSNAGCGVCGILVALVYRSLPGIVLFVLSCIGRGAIGAGDGLVVLFTGWFWGATTAIEILFWGFLVSAFFGIGMMIIGKVKRKKEIPFVPFLLLGYFIRKGLLKV